MLRCGERGDGAHGPTPVPSIAKLLDLRFGAPFAKSLRIEQQLAFAIEQLVGDLAHARGIFEHHSIRPLEIEELGRGGRVPARTEDHAHLPVLQELVRAHDVVTGLHLMVDVLDARPVGRKERDGVMDLVDPQQRGIADPVAHAGVAHLGPERLVADCIGGAKTDVAEPGDPGVALAVISLSAIGGPPHQLDAVAGRIVEGDEALHLTQFSFFRRAQPNGVTEAVKLRGGRLQVRPLGHLEGGGLIAGRAGEVAQRMIALVGLEVDRVVRTIRHFEAQVIRREGDGAVEICGAEADIRDVLQLDHVERLLTFWRSRDRGGSLHC